MENALKELSNSLIDEKISDTFYNNVKKSMVEHEGFVEMKNSLEDTFKYFKQFLIKEKQVNILLVGKVQAGKTNGFLSLVANSFDHSTNMSIILTGIDKTLKNQTANDRIIPLFKGNNNIKIFTFETIKEMKKSAKDVNKALSLNQKIIFISLKNNDWLTEVNQQIRLWDKSKIINPLIVDDEGDQASQNIHSEKDEGGVSSIFKKITEVINFFEKTIFISVTATPYAHILINSENKLKPDYSISLFPGEGYLGLQDITKNKKIIHLTKDEDRQTIKQSSMPVSLSKSLIDFMFSGAFLNINNTNVKMLVNIDRLTKEHEKHQNLIQNFIENDLETYIFDKDNWQYSLANFLDKFKIKNKEIKTEIIEEIAVKHIKKIIEYFKKANVIKIINRKSNIDLNRNVSAKYEIYIGSDLLQRGVTIKNLVVSYVSRRAKGASNADTILQMARWFGYRSEIKEFMSIYLLDQLYSDYIWIEGLDNYVRDILLEYQQKHKTIRNIERKIQLTETVNDKLLNMNLRAVRETVVKQEIFSQNKKSPNLTHIYDKLSNISINEQNYLNSIYVLLKSKWEFKKEISNKINSKFRKYPIIIFNSIEEIGINNFAIIKILLLEYHGYTEKYIKLLEDDLISGKKKFVIAWMNKQFRKNSDLNDIFDTVNDRLYDYVGKRISTIPMGDLDTYISEKRWSKFDESYFFFNMYKIKLNDPTIDDNTIIYKSITSSEYKPENEYFTITATEK